MSNICQEGPFSVGVFVREIFKIFQNRHIFCRLPVNNYFSWFTARTEWFKLKSNEGGYSVNDLIQSISVILCEKRVNFWALTFWPNLLYIKIVIIPEEKAILRKKWNQRLKLLKILWRRQIKLTIAIAILVKITSYSIFWLLLELEPSLPFSVWYPLKGHTYLFKYVWPFSGHQALKG